MQTIALCRDPSTRHLDGQKLLGTGVRTYGWMGGGRVKNEGVKRGFQNQILSVMQYK